MIKLNNKGLTTIEVAVVILVLVAMMALIIYFGAPHVFSSHEQMDDTMIDLNAKTLYNYSLAFYMENKINQDFEYRAPQGDSLGDWYIGRTHQEGLSNEWNELVDENSGYILMAYFGNNSDYPNHILWAVTDAEISEQPEGEILVWTDTGRDERLLEMYVDEGWKGPFEEPKPDLEY